MGTEVLGELSVRGRTILKWILKIGLEGEDWNQ